MSENYSVVLTDEELNSINFALISRYGMDFTNYETSSLKRRIARIMYKNKMNSVLDLWKKLLYDSDFAIQFKDEISVGMTEMFRNPSIWKYLKEKYLLKFNNFDELSIWHAGCSTGEEYYSMAIVLKEQNLTLNSKITVSDLSDRFLEAAKVGEYDLELMHKYELNYKIYNTSGSLQNYYTFKNNIATMLPAIKPKTLFVQHNLAVDEMDTKFDIIFCRNVMIYFNEKLKLQVLQNFHNSLKDNGLLIIGHFDAMPSGFENLYKYHDASLKFFNKI